MGNPKGVNHRLGTKNKKTLDDEQALENLRAMVKAQLGPMVQAQIEHSKGVSYMVLRRPDGTYARATEEAQVDAAIAAGDTMFQIHTQSPNTQAFDSLMNRAFGKPAERVSITGKDGGPLVIVVKRSWKK
jgi:thymidine phosphorylase